MIHFYFWRIASGEEVDLLVDTGSELRPIEVKLHSAPGTDSATGLRRCIHDLGLKRSRICIPIVSPAMAGQSAAHIFECLDKFAPFHLRDQEFFYLADIGHFARFDVFQEIFQILS